MKQLFFFVGWTVLCTGCGGAVLNVQENIDVPIEGKAIAIDPIKNEQKVKITASATAPIDVVVCREEDRNAVERELLAKKLKTPVFAQQLNTEEAKLEATVPANTTALVIIQRAGGKPANVKLKITNR